MGVDVTTYRIRIGCCRYKCGTDAAKGTVTFDVTMTSKTACTGGIILLASLGLITLLLQLNLERVQEQHLRNTAKVVTVCSLYAIHILCRGNNVIAERLIDAVLYIDLLLVLGGIELNFGPVPKSWEEINPCVIDFPITVFMMVLSIFTVGITNICHFDKKDMESRMYKTKFKIQDTICSGFSFLSGITETWTEVSLMSRTCSYLLGNKGAHMTHGNPHSKGDLKLNRSTTYLLEEKVHRSVGLIRVEMLDGRQNRQAEGGLWDNGTGFRVGDSYMITAYHVLRERIEFLIDNIVRMILNGGHTNVEELLCSLNMPQTEPHEHVRTIIKMFLTANATDIPLLLSRLGNYNTDEFKSHETFLWKKHCNVEFLDTPNVAKYEIDWRISFGCEETDIVIVKLLKTADDQIMPPRLYLAETYENIDKMFIVRYINDNEPEVVLDQECKVFADDEELQNAVTFSLEWWKSKFPDEVKTFSYQDCNKAHNSNTGRVILRAADSFTYGSSGSPVVYLHQNGYERQVFVSMIYQRGFPIFYYNNKTNWDKLIHEITGKQVKNDLLFEGCTTTQKLRELLKKHKKINLMDNIFDTKKVRGHLTKDQEIMRRIIKKWEEDDDKFFVETKATRHTTSRLRDSNIVTIVGCAGSGKSVAMHHAALRLQKEEFSLFVVETCSEIRKYIEEGKRQIFLIDDAVGDYAIDNLKLSEWQDQSANMKACMTGYTKLIVTIHKDIFNSISSRSDLIFNVEVIDLHSALLKMLPFDRLMYFEWNLDKRNIKTNTASLSEMIQACELQNFPLLVHMYFTDEYFEKHPSHLFEDFVGGFEFRLEQMFECRKEQFAGLILCSANQGKVKVETFDRFIDIETQQMKTCNKLLQSLGISSTLQSIGDELNKLEGIYITKTPEHYTFKHSEFKNVVTYIVGKKYETFIVTYFDATFCLKRCHLSRTTSNFYSLISKGDRNSTRDHRHSITITESMEKPLAVAFLKSMSENENLRSKIFASDFCQDKTFLKIMYDEVMKADFVDGYKTKLLQQIFCNACLYNFQELINKLLKEDIEYSDICFTGLTLTAACAYAGNSSHLKNIFLDHKNHIDLETKGFTPLGLAVLNQQIETIQILLANNCDVNLGYHTPLSISTSNCDEQILNILLDNGADVNQPDGDGLSPLANAINSEEITKLLISRSADVNMFRQGENALTPLSAACIIGQENIVNILLQNNVDLDTKDSSGITALTHSILNGYEPLARVLIQNNADINLKGTGEKATTPIGAACEKGYIDTVEILLRNKAHINNCCRHGSTPLTWAISHRNIDTVSFLLGKKADVTICGDGVEALTPLTAASMIGSAHIVLSLLSEGANINQCNGAGRTPLTEAIIATKPEVVICLLEKGADVNTCGTGKKALTPLTASSAIGSVVIMKTLLSKKADINKYDGAGKTPLTQAILRNDIDIVKNLLEEKADVNMCGNGDEAFTPLTAASVKGSLDIVDCMLTEGAAIDKYDGIGQTPLTSAILSNKHHTMEYLLDNKADVNISGNGVKALTPLTAASEIGSVGILKRLFQEGADVNKYDGMGTTPLTRAILSSKRNVIDLLLDNKADVNTCGDGNKALTPLTAASTTGSLEIAKLLLDKGADINKFDGSGKTALKQAICMKNSEVCKYLLERNVHICGGGKKALTPLTAACKTGSEDVLKLLIQKNADVNKYDGLGRTPLTTAVMRNDLAEMTFFLQMNANVDICGDRDGAFTPLTAASYVGSVDFLQTLLNVGADINKTDGNGRTPLTQAILMDNFDAIGFLLKNKPDVNKCRRGHLAFTPLTAACSVGSVNIVYNLLNEGAKTNKLDGMNNTPLTVACEKGSTDIVKLLLTKGAEINGNKKSEFTPLIHAIKNSFVNIVEYLLIEGANYTKQVRWGLSPLTAASEAGSLAVTKLLLNKGANVNRQGEWVGLPLIVAIEAKSVKMVELLLNKRSIVNTHDKRGTFPLITAIEADSVDIVRLLLNKGANVNQHFNRYIFPLIAASRKGNLEIVEILLQKGANINRQDRSGTSPLIAACENGHLQIVRLLLGKGALINQDNDCRKSSLIAAINQKSIDIVELLLKKGINVDQRDLHGILPLTAAIKQRSIEIVERLLDKGANVNQLERNGTSPLTTAIENECVEIINILIDNGAQVEIYGRLGKSPLIAACEIGSVDIVQLLLNKGALVNQTYDDYGKSPLIAACKAGHTKIVQILLLKDANVNQYLPYRKSPLIVASDSGFAEIVTILLDKGARVNEKDRYLRSALTAACEKGHVEIVELLLYNGAHINIYDGRSPLIAAIDGGSVEIVKRLVNKGAIVDQYIINADKIELKKIENHLKTHTAVNRYAFGPNIQSPLITAIKGGSVDIIDFLLNKGANINELDGYGESPLFVASSRGNLEIVKFLMMKGAKVDQQEKNRKSSLIAAIEKGHETIVELLLDKGADVNQFDSNGTSPLIAAIKTGSVRVVDILIHKGASITSNQCNRRYTSPLVAASRYGHVDIVELLLNNGALINRADECIISSLIAACEKGFVDIVEMLLDKGANVNQCIHYGTSPLIAACGAGCVDIVEILLHNGANVNHQDSYGISPLTVACEERSVRIVDILLRKGANVNHEMTLGTSPLIAACGEGCVTIVEKLINKEANVNQYDNDGTSPLIAACGEGCATIVETLLKKGVNVNHDDNYGRSPLTAASEYGHVEIVELILKNGALINRDDECRRSSIVASCGEGYVDIVEILLNEGANVNQYDCYGTSPLIAACREGYVDIVKMLLMRDAKVNQYNNYSKTPLIVAIENQHVEIVEILLDYGAKANQLDSYGISPLTAACVNGNEEIVKILLHRKVLTDPDNELISTPLIVACAAGFAKLVNLLLDKGVNVNQCYRFADHPLRFRTRDEYVVIIDRLLNRQEHANQENKFWYTPLHCAIQHGQEEVVELLLDKGAKFNQHDSNGISPLAAAIAYGNKNIIELVRSKCYPRQLRKMIY